MQTLMDTIMAELLAQERRRDAGESTTFCMPNRPSSSMSGSAMMSPFTTHLSAPYAIFYDFIVDNDIIIYDTDESNKQSHEFSPSTAPSVNGPFIQHKFTPSHILLNVQSLVSGASRSSAPLTSIGILDHFRSGSSSQTSHTQHVHGLSEFQHEASNATSSHSMSTSSSLNSSLASSILAHSGLASSTMSQQPFPSRAPEEFDVQGAHPTIASAQSKASSSLPIASSGTNASGLPNNPFPWAFTNVNLEQLLSLVRSDPISLASLSSYIEAMNDRSSPQSPSSSLSAESGSTSSLLSAPSKGPNPSHNPADLLATGAIQSPIQPASSQINSVIVTVGNAVSSPPDRMPSESHQQLLANGYAACPRISTSQSLGICRATRATRRAEPIRQAARAGQPNRPSASHTFARTPITAYEARMERFARLAVLMHAKLREETRKTISPQDTNRKLNELLEEWPFSASSALHQNTLPTILREYVAYKKAPSRWEGPKPRDQMHLLLAHVKTWMADQLIRGTLKVERANALQSTVKGSTHESSTRMREETRGSMMTSPSMIQQIAKVDALQRRDNPRKRPFSMDAPTNSRIEEKKRRGGDA